MRIQPVDANQFQTNFGAMKVHKLNIKPRVKSNLSSEKPQEKNYMQAIMFALAFIAASFTKCLIDVCNGKHRAAAEYQITTNQLQNNDDKTFKLK